MCFCQLQPEILGFLFAFTVKPDAFSDVFAQHWSQEADLLEAVSPKLFGWLPVKSDQENALKLLERDQRKIGVIPCPWSLST